MTALLNGWQGNHDKTSRYITHCRQDLGIEIVPPRINDSWPVFVTLDDKVVAYSLNAKNASSGVLEDMVKNREANGPFKNLKDFMVRGIDFGLDKGTFEALASIGAFDGIVERSIVLASIEELSDRTNKTKQAMKRAEKSGRVFSVDQWMNIEQHLLNLKPLPDVAKWALEKKFMGIYLSGHPLHRYMYYVKQVSNFKLSEMQYDVDEASGMVLYNNNVRSGRRVRFIGLIDDIKLTVTRAKKEKMAILTVADLEGDAKMLVWPDVYDTYKDLIKPEAVLDIEATIKLEADDPPVLILNSLSKLENEGVKRLVIYPETHKELFVFKEKLKSEPLSRGETPIYVEMGGIKLLLSKLFWANLDRVSLKDIKHQIIIQ